jgi:repressor LexA
VTMTAAAHADIAPVLTEHQQRVLDAIADYIRDNGIPPSRADVAKAAGLKYQNSVTVCLRHLERKGFITVTPHIARGIRLKKDGVDE